MQYRTRGQNYGPFNHVFQFAYVTRPSVFNQRLHRPRWDRVDRLVHLLRRHFHKMLNEEGNIFGALAKRRNDDRKYVQAVIQGAAKLTFGDHFFQIAMGSGDDSDVDLHRSRASQALKFPLLQNAQQFWLQVERDVSNFIEKQRASIGQLEPADLLRDRAGESASLVAKKLAIEQTAGNSGTIEFYECAI